MMYDSDDSLERALFALPLEEPPSDLRASILAATAFRPAPPFGVWEVAALGALAAVDPLAGRTDRDGRRRPLPPDRLDDRIDDRIVAFERHRPRVAGRRRRNGVLANVLHRIRSRLRRSLNGSDAGPAAGATS